VRRRHSTPAVLALATAFLATAFTPIPVAAAAGQSGPPADTVRSVDPASADYALPAASQPLTDEQTLPVIDWSELQGICCGWHA
jgi:hypothetical protein